MVDMKEQEVEAIALDAMEKQIDDDKKSLDQLVEETREAIELLNLKDANNPPVSMIRLRDMFAYSELQAMGTWCPNDSHGTVTLDSPQRQRIRAEYAYAQADAMLEARKKALEPEKGHA